MYVKKENEDSLERTINDDSNLIAKSSKKNDIPTINFKESNYEQYLKPIYYYECENCKKEYQKTLDVCDQCGSRYIKRIGTGRKCCYIDSDGKPLTPNNKYNYEVHFGGYNGDLTLVGSLFIMIFVIWPLLSIILNSLIGYSGWSLFIFCILSIIYSLFVVKKLGNNISRSKSLKVPKKYLLVKDCEYKLSKADSKLNKIVVDYPSKNGEILHLESHKYFGVNAVLQDKVDLIINPDDTEDYDIGFNLEKSIKNRLKRFW